MSCAIEGCEEKGRPPSALTCGKDAYSCRCVLDHGHAGPHECDAACRGSWTFDDRGAFVVVRFPSGEGGLPRLLGGFSTWE